MSFFLINKIKEITRALNLIKNSSIIIEKNYWILKVIKVILIE